MDPETFEIYKVISAAYREGITLKEFRQEIMQQARNCPSTVVRFALLAHIPHLSNAELQEVLDGMIYHKAQLDAEVNS